MIDRYLLRYFLAVIDQGNFSRAAIACNVAQPTLSVGIAKLERALGQTLIRRDNRRVEITEAGARFAQHARRIEAEFLLAERAASASDALPSLRLGVLTTIPTPLIETIVRELRSERALRLELVEARERDLTERLNRGRIDAALTLLRENAPPSAIPVWSEGYALAMAPDHPLAARETIAAHELADSVMLVRRHCEVLPETSRHFIARGVRPFFAARTTSDDHALAYVRAGLGLTVMPDCYGDRGMARPQLEDFGLTRTIGIVFASNADSRLAEITAALAPIARAALARERRGFG